MSERKKFNTFGGVFVPSILTILGVIMYLRLPMIVGNAGLYTTIGIIIIAHIISATTGLSVSSIATDKKIKGGGTYYMISRSLGLAIGGSLGLALFVGLSFSVSLYLIGFSEIFLSYWGFGSDINNIRIAGSIILIIITIITFISTSLVIKTQYIILSTIILSLISILFGTHDYVPEIPAIELISEDIDIMLLFGIFFPAVTGFEAGVSMSGDLSNPKRAIPLGSISAIIVGLIVYIFLAFFFSYTIDREILIGEPRVLEKISLIPELVVLGIWGATLSSAFGSILGAPRILQAIAIDKIAPQLFSKGYGKNKEPRNAVLITFVIAEMGILIGELDVIARVVSIFFITTYGFLNLSAAIESWTSSDFRPDFKISPWISLLGALACTIIMIELDVIFMFFASGILFLLFLVLKKRQLALESGDTWSGVWYSLVNRGIKYLKKDNIHERNWRPNIIQFDKDGGNEDSPLFKVGKSITGKLGIQSIFKMVSMKSTSILPKNESSLIITKDGNSYFKNTAYCYDYYQGIEEIIRTYGFSGIEPNTLLIGWTSQQMNTEKFFQIIRNTTHLHLNLIIQKYNTEKQFGKYNTIDIWWDGDGRNFNFFINLIKYLTSSEKWRYASVRILTISDKMGYFDDLIRNVNECLNRFRVEANFKIINNNLQQKSKKELLSEYSELTDLIIYCLTDSANWDKYFKELQDTLDGLGTSLIIKASRDFSPIEILDRHAIQSYDVEKELLHVFSLPPLYVSKYEILNTDINKIDSRIEQQLELLYEGIFSPSSHFKTNVLQIIEERVQILAKEIHKIDKIEGRIKQLKQLDKLLNDLFFNVWGIVKNQFFEENLMQKERIQENLSNYIQKIYQDSLRYPKTLKITYPDEQVQILDTDSTLIRKLKSRMIFKKKIGFSAFTKKVKYRDVAMLYQYFGRLLFFREYFKKYQAEEELFYHKLRRMINDLVISFESIKNKFISGNPDWNNLNVFDANIQNIQNEKSHITQLQKLYLGRMKFENRANLNKMMLLLEQIDVNLVINKKKISFKKSEELKQELLSQAQEIVLQTKSIIDLSDIDFLAKSIKNQLIDRLHKLMQEIEILLQKNIDELKFDLKKIKDKINKNENISTLKFSENELREIFTSYLEKIPSVLTKLPAELEIMKIVENEDSKQLIQLPVQRMAEFYYKTDFEPSVIRVFEQFLDNVKHNLLSAKEVLNHFYLDKISSNEKFKEEKSNEVVRQVERKIKLLSNLIENTNDLISDKLNLIFESLEAGNIEKNASQFTGFKTYSSQKVFGNIFQLLNSSTVYIQKLATSIALIKQKSEVFTHSFKVAKKDQVKVSDSLEFCETFMPKKDVLQALPLYYTTLFSNKSNISSNYFIKRKTAYIQLKKAFRRFKEGYSGAVMILGSRNSGKTTLSHFFTHQSMKSLPIYNISTSLDGTYEAHIFTRIMQHAFEENISIDEIFEKAKNNTVVIINDLELFWHNAKTGYQVINKLKNIIEKWGHKIFFILNTNPYAFHKMQKYTNLDRVMLDIIYLKPLSSSQVKDVIMLRHKSTGLTASFKEKNSSLNPVKSAFLFNAHFNFSNGNPGVALNSWMNSIKKVLNGHLVISSPPNVNFDRLDTLSQDWQLVLIEFILHKRMTSQKLFKVLDDKSLDEILLMIKGLQRSGLVNEKTNNIFQINPFVYHLLEQQFKNYLY